jgi:hypothetical protein
MSVPHTPTKSHRARRREPRLQVWACAQTERLRPRRRVKRRECPMRRAWRAVNSRCAELCNLESSSPVGGALTVVADVAGCDGAGSNSLCPLRLRLQSLPLCARRRVPRQQAPHRRRSKRLSRDCDDAGDDGAWRLRCHTWPALKRGSREPRSHVALFCSVSSHAAFLSRRSRRLFRARRLVRFNFVVSR